jgi:RNAse (barnase) inhibitor barstar
VSPGEASPGETLLAYAAGGSAVHAVPAGATVADVRVAAQAQGREFIHLDAAGVATAPAFFDRAATALALPEYFGRNWDALLDMLRDLSWRPARGRVLLCSGLQTLGRGELAALHLVLEEAARFWRDRGEATPLCVLLAGAER